VEDPQRRGDEQSGRRKDDEDVLLERQGEVKIVAASLHNWPNPAIGSRCAINRSCRIHVAVAAQLTST